MRVETTKQERFRTMSETYERAAALIDGTSIHRCGPNQLESECQDIVAEILRVKARRYQVLADKEEQKIWRLTTK